VDLREFKDFAARSAVARKTTLTRRSEAIINETLSSFLDQLKICKVSAPSAASLAAKSEATWCGAQRARKSGSSRTHHTGNSNIDKLLRILHSCWKMQSG
jgi:hypothetical protein